jgi:hypothetical protein
MLAVIRKRRCHQSFKISTNHTDHQPRSKTFQSPETNKIMDYGLWICNTLAVPLYCMAVKLLEQDNAEPQQQRRDWNRTAKCTLHDHKRGSKHNQFWKKSTTIKLNGHNMFAEWTNIDSRTLGLLWNTNQQERNPGRPLKRLLDRYIETGAGHKA